MTLNELPVGKAAVITKVGRSRCAALPSVGYGADSQNENCNYKGSADGRSHRAASAWLYSDHPY